MNKLPFELEVLYLIIKLIAMGHRQCRRNPFRFKYSTPVMTSAELSPSIPRQFHSRPIKILANRYRIISNLILLSLINTDVITGRVERVGRASVRANKRRREDHFHKSPP